MRRFEPEPRAVMPEDFGPWLGELALLADAEGAWALVGAWMHAPRECCRYLVTVPGLWEGLIARAQYADQLRWAQGVRAGRRMQA
jgi:hypothetical protein